MENENFCFSTKGTMKVEMPIDEAKQLKEVYLYTLGLEYDRYDAPKELEKKANEIENRFLQKQDNELDDTSEDSDTVEKTSDGAPDTENADEPTEEETYQAQNCPECGGTGKIKEETEIKKKCSICRGKGYKIIRRSSGGGINTRSFDSTVSNMRGETEQITCNSCDGNGYRIIIKTTYKKCPQCDGSGKQ